MTGNPKTHVRVPLALVASLLCGIVSTPTRAQKWLTIPEVTRDEVICFTLYTVHDKILKLTAQLYPLKNGEPRTVRLEIRRGDAWEKVAEAKVIEDGWTATFRVPNWDDSRSYQYRAAHGTKAFFGGTIRKNPIDKDEIIVAGFTGNSINKAHGGNIPKDDLVANIKAVDADVLFFSGDQVYNHRKHTAAWLRFGRDFSEIIKDRPTITIPDDHDVGQANLWGASGKKASTGAGPDGGYFMPPSTCGGSNGRRPITCRTRTTRRRSNAASERTTRSTLGVASASRSSRTASSRPGRRG